MVKRGLTGEALWALFSLGLVLLLPPLIGVFDKPVLVGGIPLLYLYLFIVWAGLIALIAVVMERSAQADAAAADEPEATTRSEAKGATRSSGAAGRPGAGAC